MATPSICTQCGNIDKQKLAVKGNLLIEIILWCFFFIPGIIYSIWRRSGRKNVCSVCKSDQIIPIDSPRAKKILEETSSSMEAYEENVKQQELVKAEKAKKESKLAWTILLVFIGLILLSIIISAF